MNALLLSGGRVLDPASRFDGTADVLLENGKVTAMGAEATRSAPSGVERLDVGGLVVCPGLIDLHVHLREPGQSAKETIATGTAAAAQGGFTSVVCMPNTVPAIDNAGTVALIRDKAEKAGGGERVRHRRDHEGDCGRGARAHRFAQAGWGGRHHGRRALRAE
jgi:dihydroorotase